MKFFNLLQKELKELINKQMIIGMIVSLSMLVIIGNVVGNTMNDVIGSTQEIQICDQDKTEFTDKILKQLSLKSGVVLKEVEVDNTLDDAQIMNQLNVDSVIIIPQGFTKSVLEDNKAGSLNVLTKMKSTSMAATMKSTVVSDAIDTIESTVKDLLMSDQYGLNTQDIEKMQSPVYTIENTVVENNSAEIGIEALASVTMSQGIIVPIVVFIMVIFASQMIVSAISTEKIDKTLETLLSAPVSRVSVLGAKMLAAAIMSLINAVVYMVGFSVYMGGMMGSTISNGGNIISGDAVGQAMTVSDAMVKLGLKMSVGDYFLLGLQMFMTIMIALSVSLILGAMVTDAKSAQSVITPVMLGAMVPYMVSIFADINTLPAIVKVILYAIPFTHTFNATHNIIFGDMGAFWFGLLYQFIFFIVCMYFALKLFTSDKIFTISLNFGQKRKMKKAQKV